MNKDDVSKMYFAAKSPEETASILMQKSNMWYRGMDTNGYLSKLRTMWAAYHGAYYTDANNSHSITFTGEQGELVNMAVNHLHNIAQHMITMITATRPAMQARAINTDYRSLVQTKLANGLLDYYLRDKRLENYLKKAVEYAIVLGSGYVKMEWNATSGEVYDFNEEMGTEEREGDIEFSNLSPFDVVCDPNREDNNHDWILCRTFKNKYDVAAKYPEYADEIAKLPTKSQLESFYVDSFYLDNTDLIPVYEFYHKRTDGMPDGRYLLFLSEGIALLDTPMPYRALPVYRISPSDILGTPFGYTPLFDILPIQDAINSLHSAILTNQTAFAVQNIVAPREAGINISELASGLNLIEMNMQYGEIKPLQLTATPKEVFDYLLLLEKEIETISGVNSVSRGNPDPNLRSGNALALVQSMTLQFMSGLQQSYVALVEDLGTGLINILKDHASVPRVALISGNANRTYMKEFTGADLSSINRVVVDVGNPLSRTTAGRVEMAEQMLQMGIIKSPEQYFSVINTGNLDVMTEDTQAQLFLVKAENERLVNGEPVMALFNDDHSLHIKEHGAVLSDPELRFNPELLQRTLSHIQEHTDLLRGMKQDMSGNQLADPGYLQIVGQQPLPPLPGSQPNIQQQNIPDNSTQGQVPNAMGGVPEQQMNMSMSGSPGLPQPAQAPLINGIPQPQTPQDMMMQVTGR